MKKLLILVVLCLFLPSLVFAEPEPKGVITGVILDGKTGDPLIDAGVEVVETGKKVFTDMDGKYSIELLPGTYQIRVFYPQYQGQRVKDVVVTPDKPARIDLSLEPGAVEEEVVEVIVEAAKATEATQLLIRKTAPAVTDSVSAETISKQPDPDVASVVERAPGITVRDDKYVYIRGLSERYTSASLNETSLPSTETEKRVVPLNLFSSDVIESVNVVKSYTPDIPGEFSGGMVQITTKDYPEAFEIKVSASSGYNAETTGKDFKTYKGGDMDWLAFDDGTRGLPESIPDNKEGFTTSELEKIGEDFPNIWNPTTKTAPPSSGLNFHIGNKYDRFGIVFDLTYDNDLQTREEDRIVYTSIDPDTGELTKGLDYNVTYWDESYNWSSILNMGYDLRPGHKISFKNFYTRKARDEVRIFQGYYNDIIGNPGASTLKGTRLYWSEESIYTDQLLGDHHLEPLKSLIHWRVGYGHATFDEPDLRATTYSCDENIENCIFETLPPSGTRLFSKLYEDSWEGGVDWEIDLKEWLGHPLKAKVGPALSYRDRSFNHRRFSFQTHSLNPAIDRSQDPESIYTPENIINPGGFEIQEDTSYSDHYDADHRISGGYLMLDTPYFLHENLRFVGGFRIEKSEQRLESFAPGTAVPMPVIVENIETDYFPSANLIYSLGKDSNLRLSFSMTANRPEFREIAPFEFTDVSVGIQTAGNPELKRSLINNYDLRWERFIGSEEIMALSFFYKDIKDPIERILQHTSGGSRLNTFQNALGAKNYGLEVEARKNLGFIHPIVSPLNILANYTYIDSRIELNPETLAYGEMTSKERPLQGQSAHTANVILEYNPGKWDITARLLYNYIGERISDVGTNDLPDIIEEPTQWLDFIMIKRIGNFGVKFSANNILDEEVRITQAGQITQRYKEGLSVSFGISYGI